MFLPTLLVLPPDGPDLGRYLTVCASLIGLICLLAFGFKRLFSGTLAGRAARRSLKVIDVLPLAGKNRLTVVQCYDRTFVLGLGEKSVSLVAELDPVSVPQSDSDAEAETAEQQAAFAEALESAEPLLPTPPPERPAPTRPRFTEVIG